MPDPSDPAPAESSPQEEPDLSTADAEAVSASTEDPTGEKTAAKPAGEDDDDVDELAAAPAGLDPADEESRIEVLQADESTPYHSMTTFEEMSLPADLMKGVYHMRFRKPSKIQATSLPLILPASGEYRNLIAQAHNGSGKTACFVLGMLARVNHNDHTPQAICLVPTRELARQIIDVISNLGKFTPVKSHLAVKIGEAERADESSEPLTETIVVGTPGRIADLIKKRRINSRKIRVLVLDEADEMVDTQGMGSQTVRIRRMLPAAVQVLLFSATYRDEVRDLADKIAPNANMITIQRENLSLDKIKQYYIDCGDRDSRINILSEIFQYLSLGQSIIFVRTRATASSLSNDLRNRDHTVGVLFGGEMTPAERDRIIDEFRSGTTRVLITTNVLSRGVDVMAVNTVINYDMPTDRTGFYADPETYLHRIGRTGRFGRKGVAVTFVYDDQSLNQLKDLEEYYKHPIEKVDDVEALSECLQAI